MKDLGTDGENIRHFVQGHQLGTEENEANRESKWWIFTVIAVRCTTKKLDGGETFKL